MAIYVIDIGNNGAYQFSGLSTDSKGTGSLTTESGQVIKYGRGSTFEDENGNIEKWSGTQWVQTHSGGSAKTSNIAPLPTSYTGVKTFATGGTAVPIATGTKQITLTNTDGTNFGTFAFGTSEANAISNAATGKRLFPMAAGSVSAATWSRGVPAGMTHIAGIADTAAIVVDVQQEG